MGESDHPDRVADRACFSMRAIGRRGWLRGSEGMGQTKAKRVVLVVEDDPDARRLFEMVAAEEAGLEVVGARDGQEALYRASAVQPDVVLLDLMLPRVDG